MSDIVTVLMVGAGNLGRRHLQSLKSCQHDIKILVVEPYAQALELAKAAYAQVETSGGSKQIDYYSSIEQIKDKVDVAIVATPATGRLGLLGSVLDKGTAFVVLEKVAFNSIADIDQASQLVVEKAQGAWVNCPRRLNPFYQQLKQQLQQDDIVSFEVIGENYGLACNTIHFLDLFAFLGGKTKYKISLDNIEQVVPSKRDNYIEFFGQINGEFEGSAPFKLSCSQTEGSVAFKVKIKTSTHLYLIDEIKGEVEVVNLRNDERERQGFRQPYQSELTGPLVDEVITSNSCRLTTFEDSMELHRPFIDASYGVYVASCGENSERRVPIT
jgi:predicted dehydrogenase